MSRLLRSLQESPAGLVTVLLLFVTALSLQWNGHASIAVADDIAYVVSGTNLIARGEFINPFGEPELWFPPVYPALIGLLSLGGRIDPFLVARLISSVAAIVTLVLLYRLVRRTLSSLFASQTASACALLAVALLAGHPAFQLHAVRALSESLATCLVVAALSFQLAMPRSWKTAAGTGLLTGLAALTRPECVLCLPVWLAFECWLSWRVPTAAGSNSVRSRVSSALQRGVLASMICGLTLLPYAAWLHQHTGRWTISNKGEVNLAAGRAAFHNTPREFIDPATLEMGYFTTDTSLGMEVRRYLFNCGKLLDAFIESSPAKFGAALAGLLALGGLLILWRRERTVLLALLATLPYLIVVAIYDVGGSKNLHMALPAIVMLQAVSACWLWQRHRQAGLAVLSLLLLGTLESASRQPRWTLTADRVPASELREAGQQLRSTLRHNPSSDPVGAASTAVLYENGATVTYYSGLLRRRLTPNDLPTLLAWIEKHEPAERTIYLALSEHTSAALDSSVKELLSGARPGFTPVLHRPGRQAVIVYRVERTGSRPLALDTPPARATAGL